jgi:diguanylate cyclase (GGDEF)-like protein
MITGLRLSTVIPARPYWFEGGLKKLHTSATIVVLSIVYFAAGKLGLSVAYVHPSATAVWPCTGIALVALLVQGYELWPGIFLGAFLVNITTAGSVLVCLGIAAGNTSEALAGAYLVNRFASGRNAMDHTPDVVRFTLLAGMLGTAISATLGVTSLALGGYASWSNYGPIWATWWLGDATGAVVVAPVLLLWISDHRLHWLDARFPETRLLEVLTLLTFLVLTSVFVFDGLPVTGSRGYPLEYLCVPFLIWAAYRFGPKEAATAMLVLSGIAARGTLRNSGPFAMGSPNESLLLLQAFIGVVAVMTMGFATVLADRKRAEDRAIQLAVSDPLTGLGNYRKVIEALESEIKRSDRTRRSFAFLLFDLDGLKQINDAGGHLAGNRALCRLANILQAHSREIDTPARFGGDEFVLVLPEADTEAARQIGRRIATRLREDGELPTLSVSMGEAIWPQDGVTIEALLRTADHRLYEMKRRSRIAVATSETSL